MTKRKQKQLVPMPNERRLAIYRRSGRRWLTGAQARRVRKNYRRGLG
jgi:hypothetical protein